MTAPRISILLPVFDAGPALEPCLESIRRQSLREWECVVVDDGSRDDSLARARRAAARDGRFRVLSRPHRGLVAALNQGITHCRGEFVARMDGDDWMHRDRLAIQLAALVARPDWSAVGCHVRLFPRRGLSDGMRRYEAWLASIDGEDRVRAEAFVECPVAHPTLFARTAVLRALGYRARGWPEDYDLVLRLLATGARLSVVPRRLLAWRDGPSRLSRRDPAYAEERFTACKADFLARGLLAGSDEYLLWGYGATGRALARALRRHGKRPGAIVEVHPRRLGNRIGGAPVIPPEELARRRGAPLVVSVAGAPARARIREALARLAFRETRDYVCAA